MVKKLLFVVGVFVLSSVNAQENKMFEVNSNSIKEKSGKVVEMKIGNTYFDMQTYASIQNRLIRWDDGTISAVWTMSNQETENSDRGTGYNYYSGSKWNAYPLTRLENNKTGWPVIAKWGKNGEIIVSHNGENGLEVLTRENKGEGAWNQQLLSGPSSSQKVVFPKILTNGPGNKYIHILALSSNPVDEVSPALLYFRSLDGGLTWDKKGIVIPGMDTSAFVGFYRDSYSWANSIGDTIAFVVASPWIDGVVMKSYNNGSEWNKTMFYQHPYPLWSPNIVVDEKNIFSAPDGCNSIVIDKGGKAHVFFSIVGIYNDTVDNAVGVYHEDNNALLYWSENVEEDSLVNNKYKRLGGAIDYDGDSVVSYVNNGSENTYSYNIMSGTSMPNAVIDENGVIYLVYTSIMENADDGVRNFRHIIAKKSLDNGITWSNSTILTPWSSHVFEECVFPSVQYGNDGKLHILYMSDNIPGLYAYNSNPLINLQNEPDDNEIRYLSVDTSDIGSSFELLGIDKKLDNANHAFGMFVYPNPVSDYVNLILDKSNFIEGEIVVTDISGKEMYQTKISSTPDSKYIINVGSLKPGVYTLRYCNNIGVYVCKFIKS